MPPDPLDSAFETPAESPGFLLWQVTNLWQRRQRAALKEANLTHVQFVLLASLTWLTRAGAEVSQVHLAQHAQVDVMMTSQVARTLVEKGLIARTPHPRDTRANLLQPTALGQQVARQAIRVVEQVDREFFAALSDNDALAGFTRALRRLLEPDEPVAHQDDVHRS